jgi:hypothetical protein
MGCARDLRVPVDRRIARWGGTIGFLEVVASFGIVIGDLTKDQRLIESLQRRNRCQKVARGASAGNLFTSFEIPPAKLQNVQQS